MAKWNLSLHPRAEIDAINGYQWYADRDPTAADSFRRAIKTAGQVIRRNPAVWPSHKYGTQKYKVRQFPYKIIYLVENNQILILAIAHDSRRPEYWIDRLEEE